VKKNISIEEVFLNSLWIKRLDKNEKIPITKG
jgi:hypothetical protein